MNNEEAKRLLHCYRPDGADASDPLMQEALEQARLDPSLAVWLEQAVSTDRAIAKQFKSFTPPADLRDQLLVGNKTVALPTPRARTPWFWMAVAAALILAAGVLGSVYFLNSKSTPSFVRAMTDQLDSLDRLDLHSSDLSRIRSFLAQGPSINALEIPDELQRKVPIGCRVLDWQGSKVSLVCFHLKGQGEVHLMAISSGQLKAPASANPRLKNDASSGWSTVTWSKGGTTYLLAGKIPLREMEALLGSKETSSGA